MKNRKFLLAIVVTCLVSPITNTNAMKNSIFNTFNTMKDKMKNNMNGDFIKNNMNGDFIKNSMNSDFIKNKMNGDFIKNNITNNGMFSNIMGMMKK